ncbi:MAG: CIA30 family protein [bacterium]|nr:CIA30 family protein [bacterium]
MKQFANRTSRGVLYGLLALMGVGVMDAAQMEKEIFDFVKNEEVQTWATINDTVMGGVSQSVFVWDGQSRAEFKGDVSLENNGGFASVRSPVADYDLSGFDGLLLRVRGDGKQYKVSVRMDRRFEGVAYQAPFKTKAGEWIEVWVPWENLKPQFRGRAVPDVPVLNPAAITQFGLLVSDKQEGAFALAIDWIKASHTPTSQVGDKKSGEENPA